MRATDQGGGGWGWGKKKVHHKYSMIIPLKVELKQPCKSDGSLNNTCRTCLQPSFCRK